LRRVGIHNRHLQLVEHEHLGVAGLFHIDVAVVEVGGAGHLLQACCTL